MRWALGAQAAAGGHGTADEPRVCRAVAGCRYQPGGADNSGLPTLSNRHQRHWKPDLGVPQPASQNVTAVLWETCQAPESPAPPASRAECPLQTRLVSTRARSPGPSGPTAPPRLL